jgi:Glycosyl hydrolase family 99
VSPGGIATGLFRLGGLLLIGVIISQHAPPQYAPLVDPQTDRQPGFPVRVAAYYPWYPESWAQEGQVRFSHYQPDGGYYHSDDSARIREHVAAMRYGYIDVALASWWGQGHYTDRRMPTLLAAGAGSGLHWAAYYEREGYGDPSVAQLHDDLAYLADRYGSNRSFYRIDGRPVVFVWTDWLDSCATLTRWREANRVVGAYIVMKVVFGFELCLDQPDAWHQYGPASARNRWGGTFAISPGFWKASEAAPRLDRDISRWQADIAAMLASTQQFHLITSFNEWGEGTAVESAAQWASATGFGIYLDALHLAGPGRP